MAEPKTETRCPECQRLRARVAELEQQLAAARKHSGTSSKPPSSDIVKPPPKEPWWKRKKRSRGGQPGHRRHERSPIPPEQIDETCEHTLDHCPDCGGALKASDEPPQVVQQVELVEKPIRTSEHRGL